MTTPQGITLEVPPGALAADTTITIAPAAGPVREASSVIGQAYVFGPSLVAFTTPVLITLPFDRTRLPPDQGDGDVRILGAPDGTDDFVQLSAAPVDGTKVKFSTTHFSVYAPALVHACGLPPDAGFQRCGIVWCGQGLHAEGWADFTLGCGPYFPGSNCRPNTYPSYESTEYGCAMGYHRIGWSNRFALAVASSTCVASEGTAYDTCDFGCHAGFRPTGPAQRIPCLMETVQTGTHCVSVTGEPVQAMCAFAAGSGAACLDPTPINATTYPYAKPRVMPGSCTPDEIDALAAYATATYESEQMSVTAMKAVVSATCGSCVFANGNGATWPPLITAGDADISDNFGGCIEIVSGSASCGRAYQQFFQCRNDACAAKCPTQKDRDACKAHLEPIANGPCKDAADAMFMQCGNKLAGYEKTCGGKTWAFEGAAWLQCVGGISADAGP